jgi:hypothetical protein
MLTVTDNINSLTAEAPMSALSFGGALQSLDVFGEALLQEALPAVDGPIEVEPEVQPSFDISAYSELANVSAPASFVPQGSIIGHLVTAAALATAA